MKAKFAPFLAALLFLSACAAGKPAPRNPAPVPKSRTGEYLARTASAELHIVSPGGSIRIDNLEIDNGKPPLVAQAGGQAPAQCPFPSPPAAAPAAAGGREAGAAPAGSAGSDVENKPVEQVERTDAAPGEYREPETRKGRLPGKLPE